MTNEDVLEMKLFNPLMMHFNVVDAVPGNMQECKLKCDILHLDNNV